MLARPEVVALFGFAGTANIGKLLTEKVLEEGGAALVAPYTGGEPLRIAVQPLDLPRARRLCRRGGAHGAAAHDAGHERASP